MTAQLHLAENALALHLLLQHLKGLVDIVVTDENLHSAFLFDRGLMGPMAKAPGPLALMGPMAKAPGPLARIGIVRMPMAPVVRTKGRYLRMWHHGCQLEETKASVRRRFLGSSSDKVSACLYTPKWVCRR
jgi:hypothetical protein